MLLACVGRSPLPHSHRWDSTSPENSTWSEPMLGWPNCCRSLSPICATGMMKHRPSKRLLDEPRNDLITLFLLLQEKGVDIFRMKGVLAMAGCDDKCPTRSTSLFEVCAYKSNWLPCSPWQIRLSGCAHAFHWRDSRPMGG